MFLVSNPDLVVETCRAGIVGTFPALNQRSTAAYEAWLVEIRERLDRIERDTGRVTAPFGVNLIVHKSNPRLQADLEISIKHKVPLIITAEASRPSRTEIAPHANGRWHFFGCARSAARSARSFSK